MRKSVSQAAICTKRYVQLAHLYESIFIKRPAVQKHAARHTPVRKHKQSIRNVNHDAFCAKKLIKKSIRKSIRQEAICTKTYFQHENLFERKYIKRPAVRKHATRGTPVRKKKIAC